MQILLVEDYADLGSAITSSLGDEFVCTYVQTSEAAVAQLREHHYAAILLAPRLPVSDDPVMHFLHEEQPGEVAKVILMTFPEDDTAGEEQCRVLVKPFGRGELLGALTLAEREGFEPSVEL